MTILNTTPAAKPATMSDRELFERFLDSDIIEFSPLGTELYRSTVLEMYEVHALEPLGEFMRAFPETFHDRHDLERLADELAGAAHEARTIQWAFEEFVLNAGNDEEDPPFTPAQPVNSTKTDFAAMEASCHRMSDLMGAIVAIDRRDLVFTGGLSAGLWEAGHPNREIFLSNLMELMEAVDVQGRDELQVTPVAAFSDGEVS